VELKALEADPARLLGPAGGAHALDNAACNMARV
jgi:hypothetical protein